MSKRLKSTGREPLMKRLSRIGAMVAINFTIFCVLLVFINLACLPFLSKKGFSEDIKQDVERQRYHQIWGKELVAKMHPGKTEEEIIALLKDQNRGSTIYEPYIQFRNISQVANQHLDVHEVGFRSVGAEQAPWPPSKEHFNIFFFGGSTTFGTGVNNEETFASVAQSLLRNADYAKGKLVCVYNFANPAHFSTQERIRLEQWILKGIEPDMAVFVDGCNETILWDGEPALTPFFRMVFHDEERSWRKDTMWDHAKWFFERTPMAKLVRKVVRKNKKSEAFPEFNVDSKLLDDEKKFEEVIRRYNQHVAMVKSIGGAFGIQTFFFWQPIPYYHYPMEQEITQVLKIMDEGHQYSERARHGYAYIGAHRNLLPKEVIWAADIQKDIHRWLYVDHIHYNSEGNKLLGEFIADSILKSSSP